jgi:hypothetical protein
MPGYRNRHPVEGESARQAEPSFFDGVENRPQLGCYLIGSVEVFMAHQHAVVQAVSQPEFDSRPNAPGQGPRPMPFTGDHDAQLATRGQKPSARPHHARNLREMPNGATDVMRR